ncbi:molybdopterin molybdotransferase MoeA [Olleya sp. HaHaR_3_96]|uniref:molybdopterin molybdotransferase MoeA n=1 Tax=Olleya sp. HaHaR_3_96 TaxID=2745560 RepID=UPI001C4FA001|nr:molybdopterin molybdotransferase MoeA [Olleya sp. HaHaR_3_96]QXP59362.1 molybdopterin molybdotransferase MoeA [Olleya sp. HaHaR_3_96]
MILIKDAIQQVKDNCKPLLKEVIKPIEKSGNYNLYKDIYATINMPPFRQSAMDGYAVHLHKDLNYTLVGEIKAGDNGNPILKPGDAVRIFTGSPVPDTANAIVIQENVSVKENILQTEGNIVSNQNIRPLGEQVTKGNLALPKGTKLTPAAIGYLTGLGITDVSVLKKPSIALVTTGNELIDAGQPLTYGKLYESNSKMLQNALYNLKFYDVTLHKIEDDFNKTYSILNTLINEKDVVIISGGISVGDYDFVGKALDALEVDTLFYKVKQKPGKPLFFGKKDQATIFALPGNPAAALTCFYIYVYTALQKLMNRDSIELPRIKAKSNSEFNKKGDRPQFLKAHYSNQSVTILEGQSSAMLQTFALSNALVFMPSTTDKININDQVEVIVLPI